MNSFSFSKMFDAHCHIGFAPHPRSFAELLSGAGIAAFSNTVTPDDYVAQRRELSNIPLIYVGLGLHPWWIAQELLSAKRETFEGEGHKVFGKKTSITEAGANEAIDEKASANEAIDEKASTREAIGKKALDKEAIREAFIQKAIDEKTFGVKVASWMSDFERLAPYTQYIGEIGLDFSKRFKFSREAQIAVFERCIAACMTDGETSYCSFSSSNEINSFDLSNETSSPNSLNIYKRLDSSNMIDFLDFSNKINQPNHSNVSPKIISIHAVKSSTKILDILEKTGCSAVHCCIFHRFQGSYEEVKRAYRLGCFFSINPKMRGSKVLAFIEKNIPRERILFETDLPSAPTAFTGLTISH